MQGRLVEGTSITLARDVDLRPHTVIQRGEKGLITRTVSDVDGLVSVEVLLDKAHAGLFEYQNHAYLEEPELTAVIAVRQGHMSAAPSVGIGTFALGLFGWLAPKPAFLLLCASKCTYVLHTLLLAG